MKFRELFELKMDDYDSELKKANKFFEKKLEQILNKVSNTYLQVYGHPDEKVKFMSDVIKNAKGFIKKIQ